MEVIETGGLEILATVSGYTTHLIYSRSLDTARAGDLDGAFELLVPDESNTELGAIRRIEEGAPWSASPRRSSQSSPDNLV